MRYALAGGKQYTRENISGYPYCFSGLGWAEITSLKSEIKQFHDGLMESPGHREAILDEHNHKVNLGLWWTRHMLSYIQQFEYDFFIPQANNFPLITDGNNVPSVEHTGLLIIGGGLQHGVHWPDPFAMSVSIFYNPPPEDLTRGQLGRAECYSLGKRVASLRPELEEGWTYPTDIAHDVTSHCGDPYTVPISTRAPEVTDIVSLPTIYNTDVESYELPWIGAGYWQVEETKFELTADINQILDAHGPGIYTLAIWAQTREGEVVPILEHSLFWGIDRPELGRCKGCITKEEYE